MHYPIFPLLLLSLATVASCTCYDDCSRCTPATAFWTGILWKDCADYCRQCKGRESGACEKVDGGPCIGGYQCQSNGGNVEPSDSWIVKATCAMGL